MTQENRYGIVLLFLIALTSAKAGASDDVISIHHGCYRDVECGKGEYCDTESKGCSVIPQCEPWQARKDGDDYGACVSCRYDLECNWTVDFGRSNDHSHCWRGDGVCRQKPPFVMGTYSWDRKYDAKKGFIDTLTPSKKFSQGKVMCFVVATPFPPEYAHYLRVSLDRVQLCALRQTAYEALIRLEESRRVEDHHGIVGVHKHHGIIPYDAEDHDNTGCRTASGHRLNHHVLQAPVHIDDEHPLNTTFEIVDSETGSSALCISAKAISPDSIPVYVETTVSIEPQDEAIRTLLASDNEDMASQVTQMLQAYGISSSSSVGKRGVAFPPAGPTDPQSRHTTLVVSDLDDEAYVLCPHGSHFDGHHGHCASSHFQGEFYLWTAFLSGGAFFIGGVGFVLSWPSHGGVIVI